MEKKTTRKHKWLKITGIVIGSLLLLIIAAVVWLQTASGKNFIRNKAVSFLEKKIGTPVRIGRLDFSLPKWIELQDVLFIDQHKDTLLSGGSLKIDLDMLQLISGTISINEVHLKNINANIYRKPNDSSFNYQYIADAFASKQKDTASKKQATQISLDRFLLDTVSLRFNDSLNQMFCAAFVGSLKSSFGKLDLDKMDYEIKDLVLHNTSVTVADKSTKKAKAIVAATAAPSPLNLLIKNVDVHKLNVSYANVSSKLDYRNLIDTFQLRDATLHLLEETFTAKKIVMNNSTFAMMTNDPNVQVKDTIAKVIDSATKQGWNVKVEELRLNKNNVALDNNAFGAAKEGMDYNHLKLNEIFLQTNNIHYNKDTINANILNGSITANKFAVKQLKGDVVFNDKRAAVKGLIIATQNSLFDADGEVVFNKTKRNEMLTDASAVDINLNRSYLGYNEILFFIPSFKRKAPLDLKPSQKLLMNAKANGTLKDINISYVDMRTDDGRVQLSGKGKAYNVMNTKMLKYDLAINKLYFDKSILSSSMKQQLQKSKLNLPSNIMAAGTVAGSMNDVNTKMKLNSAFGAADIKASVANFSNPKNMKYNLDLTGNKLQTGKWIYMDSLLGLFTGNIKIKGTGTDYKKDNINSSANIKSFTVKGYTYNNVNLNAELNRGSFTAKGNINDENIASAIDLAGTINGKYPTVKGTIAIDKADLRKLNFTKDSVSILTTVFIDAQNLDPKNIDALLLLDSTILTFNGKRLFADSISLKATAGNDSTQLFVKAPFANASMIGKYDYEHLPVAINAFIQHNYFKKNTDTLKVVDQQMVLNATLVQDDIMRQFVPALVMQKPAVINASFDNSRKDTSLFIRANIPSVVYSTTAVAALNFSANGLDSTLNFALSTDTVTAGGKKFYNAGVVGNLADNALKVTVKTDDDKKREFYAISAVIELQKEETKFHLADSLRLNYDKWAVAPNNSIEIKKEGYIINNFAINKGVQSILINNQQPTATSPIVFKIDNFNLGDVLAIANQDSTMAGGILNVNAVVMQPIQGLPNIDGTAGIQKLTFKNVPIGDLNLATNIAADKTIKVKGGLTGPNELTIDGGYNTTNSTFSISTQVNRLNLKAVEAFSGGMITRTAGNIHGEIYANGAVSDPRWKGELVFDTAQLATAMFGSLYKINNQKIDLEYPAIGLYDFTITDSLGNKLVLDGNVKTEGKDMALDLNVNANNFLAVNQRRNADAMVYGQGYIDAAMHLGGSSASPDISGNVTLNDKSDIHYVMPAKNNYKDDLKQVVKFIDIDTIRSFKNSNVIFTSAADTIQVAKFAGLKYNLNLEINENANVTVLIDPTTGDELTLKGSAQLNAGVDENGILGLTGVYQLKQGSYSLSYQFIKRKFDLVDGSTITFAGNPMQGTADITAQYEVETSAKELLGNEVSENSASLGSAYNKKVPFRVLLKIKGTLTKPTLSFDIRVKENAEGVNNNLATTINNKLDQYRNSESDMNKQVFALLILGRFIGDRSSDFFASGGSNTSTGDVVKQSVSKFLAEAVDQIAGDLIKGVDINLDLKNYQGDASTNTANRTDLNVELSKQLLNDRLTVTVGKSFTVEGDDPLAKTQNNSNLQFLPDITTTYKLSKDGKYALRAYRKNQYEAILDGYFTETGIAFTLTMNYEKFRELFQGKKAREQQALKVVAPSH